MKKIFTILSLVFIFSLTFTPALADGNDAVANENEAMVMNGFEATSNTGMNYADGSYGGEGGNGGDIRNGYSHYRMPYATDLVAVESVNNGDDAPDGDVEDSTTGNGGMGGNAADGGTVVTGDAATQLTLENWTNRNLAEIDRCACEEDNNDDGDIRVRNLNRAMAMNMGGADANTGLNDAEGSYGGEGGNGGDIKNAGEGDVEDSTTGSGADAGAGALGGLIQTGNGSTMTDVINRINENVTRIRR